MAIAGRNIPINPAEGVDKITVTEKVTTPYFSDGNTQLSATNIITQSLADANETYYYGIANSSTPTVSEFDVTYGHVDGNGGDDIDDTIKSPTQVIYKQWASLLLGPTEVTGGFFISSNGSSGVLSSGTKESEIYVVKARRTNMKDRLNKKNWTIFLTGSAGTSGQTGAKGAGHYDLSLTDDSANDNPTATHVGDRYNIVSGSDGTIVRAASEKVYGHFYPDIGVMVFSGAELSASIPGDAIGSNQVAKFDSGSFKGFATYAPSNLQDNDYKNALRFINCLQPNGAKMKFRDEEDQVSVQYFCRVRAGECNFSNNPTFVSGSLNELRHTTMKGNPSTFITQVQMFNSAGDIVAIGNLSTPLKKNFSSEATIKVKLTY